MSDWRRHQSKHGPTIGSLNMARASLAAALCPPTPVPCSSGAYLHYTLIINDSQVYYESCHTLLHYTAIFFLFFWRQTGSLVRDVSVRSPKTWHHQYLLNASPAYQVKTRKRKSSLTLNFDHGVQTIARKG